MRANDQKPPKGGSETPLPPAIASDSDQTLRFLLAYEAAFRALGDMSGSDED